MNGRRLAEELLRRRPGLRILFTSGYTANVILQHGVLEEGVEFLAKPYSAQSLAQRVRALLDAPRPGRSAGRRIPPASFLPTPSPRAYLPVISGGYPPLSHHTKVA